MFQRQQSVSSTARTLAAVFAWLLLLGGVARADVVIDTTGTQVTGTSIALGSSAYQVGQSFVAPSNALTLASFGAMINSNGSQAVTLALFPADPSGPTGPAIWTHLAILPDTSSVDALQTFTVGASVTGGSTYMFGIVSGAPTATVDWEIPNGDVYAGGQMFRGSAGGTWTLPAGFPAGQDTSFKADFSVPSPPSISKVFGAASVTYLGSTSLSFTIQNPNAVTLNGVAFSDTLPAGLVVSTPSALSSNCGGTATAIAGSSAISLVGGTLSGASCTVVVNVTGTTPGTKNNVSGAVSSTNGGTGNQASASLTVTNACPSGQPAFIYPTNGQSNVDGSVPFSWCAVAGAQYYYLTVGTGGGGYDVVNSGNLPGSQTSFNTGMLPAGRTLYARIWAYVGGLWRTTDISFTTPAVAPGMFTSPTNGQTGVTAPRLFTWTASPQAQFYYLTVGTTGAGYDVVNSGNLPASQTSYNVTSLPAHRTLYARLYSYINGNWVTQDITFTTA